MYLLAFLLTLRASQVEAHSSSPASHVLCTSLNRFLSQQQAPRAFMRVAPFSHNGMKTTFRITIGERRVKPQACWKLSSL